MNPQWSKTDARTLGDHMAITNVGDYKRLLGDIGRVFTEARGASARTVNAIMTAAYWVTGRRIVEFEQGGARRARYGRGLLKRLAADLTRERGRGFSVNNLQTMRLFYLTYPPDRIYQTLSAKFDSSGSSATETTGSPSRKPEALSPAQMLRLSDLAAAFPLPWSQYVLLLRARSPEARAFYEEEALRGGWSVRTLDRQMSSLFYERTALSRDKAAMLRKHAGPKSDEALTPEEAIKDPLLLEFLDLKDEYSETDLEDALIRHLEQFLLELGDDFAFVARQRRLRLDGEWYRVDLVFFHRRLRCLLILDLKLGKFTHADAGQMHLYLNYAREHWTKPGENPPVGLILCTSKTDDVARYALEGLPNKVVAAEYRLALPEEKALLAEIRRTRRAWELRRLVRRPAPNSEK